MRLKLLNRLALALSNNPVVQVVGWMNDSSMVRIEARTSSAEDDDDDDEEEEEEEELGPPLLNYIYGCR